MSRAGPGLQHRVRHREQRTSDGEQQRGGEHAATEQGSDRGLTRLGRDAAAVVDVGRRGGLVEHARVIPRLRLGHGSA